MHFTRWTKYLGRPGILCLQTLSLLSFTFAYLPSMLQFAWVFSLLVLPALASLCGHLLADWCGPCPSLCTTHQFHGLNLPGYIRTRHCPNGHNVDTPESRGAFCSIVLSRGGCSLHDYLGDFASPSSATCPICTQNLVHRFNFTCHPPMIVIDLGEDAFA